MGRFKNATMVVDLEEVYFSVGKEVVETFEPVEILVAVRPEEGGDVKYPPIEEFTKAWLLVHQWAQDPIGCECDPGDFSVGTQAWECAQCQARRCLGMETDCILGSD